MIIIYFNYYNYAFIDNSFLIPTYLHSLEEYQIVKRIACKHHIAVILYSESYYVLKAKKFSFAVLVRDYYNFVHKMISDKNKLKSSILINNNEYIKFRLYFFYCLFICFFKVR